MGGAGLVVAASWSETPRLLLLRGTTACPMTHSLYERARYTKDQQLTCVRVRVCCQQVANADAVAVVMKGVFDGWVERACRRLELNRVSLSASQL